MSLDLRQAALALGGDIASGQVIAPGPGHSAKDRSLAVKPDATAPGGFVCWSHAGDDWQACRDHVTRRLGLDRDAWKRTSRTGAMHPSPPPATRGGGRLRQSRKGPSRPIRSDWRV